MKYLDKSMLIPWDMREDFQDYAGIKIGYEVPQPTDESGDVMGHIDFCLIPKSGSGKEEKRIRMEHFFRAKPESHAREVHDITESRLLLPQLLDAHLRYRKLYIPAPHLHYSE